jgi:PST family polysaccharide transporter
MPISPEHEKSSLTERTGRAARWSFTSAMVKASVHFVVGIILARLLPPEDFGLVAIAMIFIGFTNIFANFGLAPAIIQRRSLTSGHIRTGFTSSVILGFATTILIALLSPYATIIFDHSELPSVLAILSTGFTINGFGSVSRALLERNLRHRDIFRVNVASQALGFSIAILMAYTGFGVWSLIVSSLAGKLLKNLLFIILVRHNMAPLISREELHGLVSFGFGVSLNQIVNYTAKNGDNFLIGSLLGASSLGLYNRAYNLMNLPNRYISGTLSGVLFPAFSEIQNHPQKFRRAYLESTQLISMIAGPVMTGILIAAPDLITGLYGKNWTGAIIPLQILSVGGYFRALYHIGGAVSHASSNVYRELLRQIQYAALVISGAIIGSFYGIIGVAAGITIALIFMYVAMAQLSMDILKIRLSQYIIIQYPGFLLSAIVGSFCGGIKLLLGIYDLPSFINLAILISSCALALFLGLFILPRNPRTEILFKKVKTFATFLPDVMNGMMNRILWTRDI